MQWSMPSIPTNTDVVARHTVVVVVSRTRRLSNVTATTAAAPSFWMTPLPPPTVRRLRRRDGHAALRTQHRGEAVADVECCIVAARRTAMLSPSWCDAWLGTVRLAAPAQKTPRSPRFACRAATGRAECPADHFPPKKRPRPCVTRTRLVEVGFWASTVRKTRALRELCLQVSYVCIQNDFGQLEVPSPMYNWRVLFGWRR